MKFSQGQPSPLASFIGRKKTERERERNLHLRSVSHDPLRIEQFLSSWKRGFGVANLASDRAYHIIALAKINPSNMLIRRANSRITLSDDWEGNDAPNMLHPPTLPLLISFQMGDAISSSKFSFSGIQAESPTPKEAKHQSHKLFSLPTEIGHLKNCQYPMKGSRPIDGKASAKWAFLNLSRPFYGHRARPRCEALLTWYDSHTNHSHHDERLDTYSEIEGPFHVPTNVFLWQAICSHLKQPQLSHE